MNNDDDRQSKREIEVDEEMATADRSNGERRRGDEHRSPQRSAGADPAAPGRYVDDEDAVDVAEPNEPA